MTLLQIFGVLFGLYTCYGLYSGVVYVKDRIWAKRVERKEAPVSYWFGIIIYAALTCLLLFSPVLSEHAKQQRLAKQVATL